MLLLEQMLYEEKKVRHLNRSLHLNIRKVKTINFVQTTENRGDNHWILYEKKKVWHLNRSLHLNIHKGKTINFIQTSENRRDNHSISLLIFTSDTFNSYFISFSIIFMEEGLYNQFETYIQTWII